MDIPKGVAFKMVTEIVKSRGWWWLSVGFLFWAALHLLPVTWLAYRPISVEVSDGKVVMTRDFPGDLVGLPRPRIAYVETVRPLTPGYNGGQRCEDAGGPFRYGNDNGSSVASWSIATWASPCLSDPNGFVWSATWTWHLGALRLGPVSLRKTVLR